MEEKKNKKILKAIMIIVLLIIVVGIGITIAYFTAQSLSNTQTIKTGGLSIVYEEDSKADIEFQITEPIYDEEIEDKATKIQFRAHSFVNEERYMNISIEEIEMAEELKTEDFRWALYETDSTYSELGTKIADGDFTNTEDVKSLKKDITVPGKEIKYYTLYLWLRETDEKQIGYGGKEFSGKIVIYGNEEKSSIYFVDNTNANEPVLAPGMIPVVYNDKKDTWQVADTNEGWYAYQDQIWANAVTVSDETLRSAAPETEIPMDDINSMWVWIPRYKYKITGSIGSSSNVTNPPQIEVEFESGTSTTGEDLTSCSIDSTNCYYTHPAFRNGNNAELLTKEQVSAGGHTGWDTELTGIWVGKFETGTDDTTCNSNPTSANCNKELNPIIKPDVPSLRYQTVSNQFKTSLKFAGGTMAEDGTVTFTGNETYGLPNTVDTHMMKNTEWGAVAYFSQSKYGKNGNDNYKDADKEIYKNDSSNFYTGRSSGKPPTSGSSATGTYSYNGKSCSKINYTTKECTGEKTEESMIKGTGASTTGTIYGVYDMSGGAYEYTMGNWAETTKASYFTKFPEQKYWDKYTGTSSSSIKKENAIKGDATYETMMWFSDNANFVKSDSPWFTRGGYCDYSSSAGVVFSNFGNGTAISYNGSRSMLIP